MFDASRRYKASSVASVRIRSGASAVRSSSTSAFIAANGSPLGCEPMPAQPVEDRHEWVSFEDPDEDRTWVFDVTFLMSKWSCIYGRGCQGVLTGPAPELMHGCCTH